MSVGCFVVVFEVKIPSDDEIRYNNHIQVQEFLHFLKFYYYLQESPGVSYRHSLMKMKKNSLTLLAAFQKN